MCAYKFLKSKNDYIVEQLRVGYSVKGKTEEYMYYWFQNNEEFKKECKKAFVESILTKLRNVNTQFSVSFAYYFSIDVCTYVKKAKRQKKQIIYLDEEPEVSSEFYDELEKEEENKALAWLERLN